jgi:hypothetical protein
MMMVLVKLVCWMLVVEVRWGVAVHCMYVQYTLFSTVHILNKCNVAM